MRQSKAGLLAMLFTLLLAGLQPAFAGDDPDTLLGKQLLTKLWQGMKHADVAAIEALTASGFQSVHAFGAADRLQEIALIKGLKMHDYSLSDIHITRHGPVIVATYFVSVEETIRGERLTKRPAARMSVFVESNGVWQWVAHANLKPMGQSEQ